MKKPLGYFSKWLFYCASLNLIKISNLLTDWLYLLMIVSDVFSLKDVGISDTPQIKT